MTAFSLFVLLHPTSRLPHYYPSSPRLRSRLHPSSFFAPSSAFQFGYYRHWVSVVPLDTITTIIYTFSPTPISYLHSSTTLATHSLLAFAPHVFLLRSVVVHSSYPLIVYDIRKYLYYRLARSYLLVGLDNITVNLNVIACTHFPLGFPGLPGRPRIHMYKQSAISAHYSRGMEATFLLS
jgi:hypothetical protein